MKISFFKSFFTKKAESVSQRTLLRNALIYNGVSPELSVIFDDGLRGAYGSGLKKPLVSV